MNLYAHVSVSKYEIKNAYYISAYEILYTNMNISM